jgi:hypothetical protein
MPAPATVSRLTLEWQHDDGTLERLTVDASEREGYESSGEATEHAVETGVVVSDHVKPNADHFSFDCVVTNAPITTPGNQADGVTGSVRALQITAGNRRATANVLQFSAPFDRVRACDARLRALKESATLLTVYTGLRVVEHVLIERYAPERSAANGAALHFALELRVLRVASTLRVAGPRRVRRRPNRGPQPVAPPENVDVLHRLRAWYAGALGN